MINIFSQRIRGFRIVEVAAFAILLLLILGVYLAKTFAGRERAQIAQIEARIADETARVRLLKAEVAFLEQPGRLERLAAQHLGLRPITAAQEIAESDLLEVARTGKHAKAPKSPAPPPVPAVEESVGQVDETAEAAQEIPR